MVRCGQCTSCRLERSRQWAVRCMHEASLYRASSFVTLTYGEELESRSLQYRDFQLFAKRVRRKLGRFRFFMCGEYGERNWRPHFHAAMFGVHFADRYPWRKSPAGFQLYRSPELETLWTHGSSEIGDVTFESAAYIARYCMKKSSTDHSVDVDGAPGRLLDMDFETGEIVELEPEFCRMSLRPGIGAAWFDKFRADVFPLDRAVVRGSEQRPPTYYFRRLRSSLPLMAESVRQERLSKVDEICAAEGPSLASMAECAEARLKQRGRKL